MADAVKTPVYKTLGFWATLVLTNLGLLTASGLLMDGSAAKVVGWVVTVLTALGYKALSDKASAPPAA